MHWTRPPPAGTRLHRPQTPRSVGQVRWAPVHRAPCLWRPGLRHGGGTGSGSGSSAMRLGGLWGGPRACGTAPACPEARRGPRTAAPSVLAGSPPTCFAQTALKAREDDTGVGSTFTPCPLREVPGKGLPGQGAPPAGRALTWPWPEEELFLGGGGGFPFSSLDRAFVSVLGESGRPSLRASLPLNCPQG